MSYARRIRRKRDRQLQRDAIAAGKSAVGCRCRPDVEHHNLGRLRHVVMHHDDWCPAADAGSQVMVARGHDQTSADFAATVVDVVRALQDRGAR